MIVIQAPAPLFVMVNDRFSEQLTVASAADIIGMCEELNLEPVHVAPADWCEVIADCVVTASGEVVAVLKSVFHSR